VVKHFLFFCFSVFQFLNSYGSGKFEPDPFFYEQEMIIEAPGQPLPVLLPLLNKLKTNPKLNSRENKRLIAFALAVTLGHFGVHRLYLGTETIVPIAYVLTMGGGFGLIPAIDATAILFTKDIEKYENNPKYFMWAE
jgi:TM2 domain-containing membrane protein YozV